MIISKDARQFINIADKIRTERNEYTLDDATDRLGAGGNAAVYECIDRQGTTRAIKFLLNISEKAHKRFTQEKELLLRLEHPHIIKCFDYGKTEGINRHV